MMDKVWLHQYTASVPSQIDPDVFSSIPEMFEKYAAQFSKRPAFSNFGVTLTYQTLKKQVDNFAAFLQQDWQLKKGDRFAIMMPNLLQYPVAIYGALKAGLIVVNVNPLYTAPELVQQLQDSGAKAILVLENFADRLAQALDKTKVSHVMITKIGDLLGPCKGRFYNFVVKHIRSAVPQYHIPNPVFFNKALMLGSQSTFSTVSIKNTDVAFLQYTGGTTGRSKGAKLSHRNLIANVLQCVAWIHDVKEQYHGVLIGALPMYHVFSLTVCGMCILPMGASTLLITNPKDISGFIKLIRHCKMTMVIGVNTLFNALLNHLQFKTVDFSRLKLTIAGGMAMQKPVAERWHEATKLPILQGYGLTESSPVLTLCPTNMPRFTGSVGLPVPSTEIEIRDDRGNEVPLMTVGEICGRGPQVMSGYWYADVETKETIDEDGWLRTGDLGYMDEQGYVYIVDRKKDMVLISGFNVYPNEVEEVLAAHPDVKNVAVIGVPSEKTGEALKAFIVSKNPALTKESLIAFCRESLTGYKIPHIVEFCDELPLTPVGKVLRRELRARG